MAGIHALMMARGASAPPPPLDPSVLRVLGDNGVSTTFIDRSPSAFTLTTAGSAVNSTTTVGTGAYSVSLPTSGSYFTAPDSPAWNTDVAMTWEALVYIDVAAFVPGTYYTIVSQSSVGNARHVFVIITDTTSAATLYYLENNAAGTQILAASGSVIAPRTAVHVAAVLNGSGNTIRLFIGGAASSTTTQLAAPTDCTSPLHIGAWYENGGLLAARYFIGNLKVRISPSALYTVSFTAPTDFP